MRPLFILRWSARDLRRRWLQVVAIALIIAVGTGVFAALGSTATWRRESNDASFETLEMYDLRVKAAEGLDAPAGSLLAALGRLPDPGVIAHAEERLVVPTQVDASTPTQTILVPGRLIGVDVTGGGPHINKVWVKSGDGRTLASSDQGGGTVVLERNFSTFYDLARRGTISVAGRQVEYVGSGMSPEYFFVVTDDGSFFAEANFAAVFAPLDTAQTLADRPGRVNDLVLRLRPGSTVSAVRPQVERAFSDSGLAVTVMERSDEDAFRLLYDDIEGDQKFWNVFALLILAGAAFGAFNLANRMVEAQRREIGIGMSLGAPPRVLALRPLFVGIEIAVLGVVFGVGMGLGVVAAIRPVYTNMLPLPVWHTDLQLAMFAKAAAIGFVIPVVATAWPVWRAVRVLPVDAITTTHRSSRGGLSPMLRRLPWPRSTYARMPFGNVLRTPRRTLLTAFGIAAAVTALISILGMIDSFVTTIDRNDREVLQDHPDRVTVALQGFHLVNSAEITAITSTPSVGEVQPVLRFGARLSAGTKQPIDLLVDVIDLDSTVWAPTVTRGEIPSDRGGLIISAEAASDLRVGPGDMVTLEHPAQRGNGFELVRTSLRVAAVHPSPYRFAAYVDRSQLPMFGVPDVVNQLYILPARGSTPQDVQRALFGRPAVASAQPVSATSKVVKDSLNDFVGIFRVLQLFILLLALLIAYNAASINTDERRREHATLFAFGLPLRRILRMDIMEALLIGLLGTGLGLIGGIAVLRWVTSALIGNTLPELGLDVTLSAETIGTAILLGVIAVAAAPLLTIHRLRRMDIPTTLRIVE
jgi:putative ABC transport system permease protein